MSRVIVARAKSASRRCTAVPFAAPGCGKDTNASVLCFFVRCPVFSFADVDSDTYGTDYWRVFTIISNAHTCAEINVVPFGVYTLTMS